MNDLSSYWPQITRYVSGEASADERAALELWASERPEHRELFDQAARLWEARSAAAVTAPEEIERQLARLSARIGGTAPPPSLRHRSPQRTRLRWIAMSASAVVLLAVSLSIPRWNSGRTSTSPQVTNASGEYKVYNTRPGQRAVVELSDGTRVSINSGSTLEVPRDFGASSRRIRLVGHATFDVRHHTTTPFVVDAAGTQTTVLGTEFSVYAYSSRVRVAVKSGRVSVGACGETQSQMQGASETSTRTSARSGTSTGWCGTYLQQAIVDANEIAAVTPSGHIVRDARPNIARDFAFMSGYLILDNMALGDVVDDLSRWYDADIQLSSPSLRSARLGGWLSEGSIDDFIQYLTGTLPVRVSRNGRVITISPLE